IKDPAHVGNVAVARASRPCPGGASRASCPCHITDPTKFPTASNFPAGSNRSFCSSPGELPSIMDHTSRIAGFFVGALLGCVLSGSARAADHAFFHENVMGTSLELRVRADDEPAAQWAEDRVLREIDRLSAIFSGYDATSEFSRWQSAVKAPVPVSSELF